MVDDLELAAKLAVLVAERIEAVWAGGHDGPFAHAVAVECLDVAGRKDLEDVVVTHSTRRIPGAGFLLAKDREVDPRRVEAGRHGACDLLVARVECRRAADPVEDLEIGESAHRRDRSHDRHLERQAPGPVRPGARGLAPRVALVLHRPERRR